METRYAYVARKLVEDIASGKYPVGFVLPNEFDLARKFAVSRSTIRSALRELEVLGMVNRRRSAGTRVESASPAGEMGEFAQTLSSVEEVQQFGSQTLREVISVDDVVIDVSLAKILGCGAGTRWLRISFVRRSPGALVRAPICWTDVYIDAAFASAVRDRIATHAGIYGSLLEEISGRQLVEIDQTITAIGVPERVASKLEVEVGSHALEFRRKYILSPRSLAEISLSVHPADRFSYRTRLRRQTHGQG